MSQINDGGPAFPRVGYIMPDDIEPEQWIKGVPGMSLRDWFAGQALAGIIASLAGNKGEIPNLEKSVAQTAYDYADEMLLAREGGGS